MISPLPQLLTPPGYLNISRTDGQLELSWIIVGKTMQLKDSGIK